MDTNLGRAQDHYAQDSTKTIARNVRNKHDCLLVKKYWWKRCHKPIVLKFTVKPKQGRRYGGCVGCRTPLASEAVGNFLNFVLLSANLETFYFRKYFVGNISRPSRKSTSLLQQRDIEHPLDTNKDGRM